MQLHLHLPVLPSAKQLRPNLFVNTGKMATTTGGKEIDRDRKKIGEHRKENEFGLSYVLLHPTGK